MVRRHRHPGKYKSRTPKGYYVYKRRPIHILTKDKRDIIQRLDKKQFETGGRLDFNRRGLERADVWVGNKRSVDIPLDPDMEVDFHTHPKERSRILDKMNYFHSKSDMYSFKESPSQYSMVLHKDRAMGMKKTKKFKLNEKQIDDIEEGLQRDYRMPVDKLFKRYKPKYERMGVKMDFFKPKTSMKLPFFVVEPKGKRLTKAGFFFGDGDLEKERQKSLEEFERELEEKEERRRAIRDLELNTPLGHDEVAAEEQAESIMRGEKPEPDIQIIDTIKPDEYEFIEEDDE